MEKEQDLCKDVIMGKTMRELYQFPYMCIKNIIFLLSSKFQLYQFCITIKTNGHKTWDLKTRIISVLQVTGLAPLQRLLCSLPLSSLVRRPRNPVAHAAGPCGFSAFSQWPLGACGNVYISFYSRAPSSLNPAMADGSFPPFILFAPLCIQAHVIRSRQVHVGGVGDLPIIRSVVHTMIISSWETYIFRNTGSRDQARI